MSNVSETHQFTPLEKNTRALSGQRLVRIIAKKSKDDTYESQHLTSSLAMSVPRIAADDIVAVIDKLIPHVIGMCEGVQDKIIREWRIQSGRNEITQAQIGLDQVVAYLDASGAGNGRITKEYMAEWFAAEYASYATDWFTSRMGFSQDVAEAKTAHISELFAGFASPKYSPADNLCKVMIGFVDKAVGIDNIDSRMESILGRIEKIMTEREEANSLDALGFSAE